MSNTTKNEHIVPKFYLRGFAIKGQSWAIRRDESGRCGRLFKANVSDLCAHRYYYEIEAESPKDNRKFVEQGAIEDHLSEVEDKLSKPLRKVIASRSLQELQDNAMEHLLMLKFLLTNFIVRSPASLEAAKAESQELADQLNRSGFFTQEDRDGLAELEYTQEDVVRLACVHTELFVMEEGSSMWHVLDWLNSAGVVMMRAPEGSQFITADIPFAIRWDEPADELPSLVYLPLDFQTAMVFHTYDRWLKTRELTHHEVAECNHWFTSWSDLASTFVSKSREALASEFEAG